MVWIYDNVASNENKIPKLKSSFLFLLIFTCTELFTYSRINPPIANLLMLITILALSVLFYRKSILDAFVGFGLSYMYITLTSYIVITIYKSIFIPMNFKISKDNQRILFIYLPVLLSYFIFYKARKQFFSAGLYLKNLKHSLLIIQTIDYTLLLVGTLQGEWATKNMAIGLKAILIAIFSTLYIFIAIYFAKINDKSKELEILNEALNAKITELRKVKHDYGSEISAIYGLYQLGNYEKLGEIVKGVIEKNQTTSDAIEVGDDVNPIIKSLLNQASGAGINVLIFDKADYNDLKITDHEFLKLISNIINNGIDAMKDTQNPIIRYNSYNSYDGVKITIENNGAKISPEIINIIFNVGFSTKANLNCERGFGLSIVMDIIKRCGGSITVESNDQWTKFAIDIPRENNKCD